jgi:opacity protein-like surface antigen
MAPELSPEVHMPRVMTTAALVLLFAVGSAEGQDRFGLELRGGAAFPDQTNLDGAKPNTGAGLGLTASVRALPNVHFYVGWEWHHFTFDVPFDADLDDTGYAFGAQFQRPVAGSLDFWLRGGGNYSKLKIDFSESGFSYESEHALGWELGGGVAYAIAPNFALTPGIRYRASQSDLDIGKDTGPYPMDHSYVLAELGVSWTFGGAPAVAAARAR